MTTVDVEMTPAEFILAFIDEELQADEIIPAEVAQRIHERMMKECNQEAERWLHDQALKLLTSHIRQIINSRRARARASASVNVFRQAAQSAKQGDLVPLTSIRMMDTMHKFSDGPERRPLRELDGNGLKYVGSGYQSTAERHAMLAAFYRTLAKLAGKKRLGEVLDEERVREVYRQITHETDIELPVAS